MNADLYLSANVENNTVSGSEHLRALSRVWLRRRAAHVSRSSNVAGPATWFSRAWWRLRCAGVRDH